MTDVRRDQTPSRGRPTVSVVLPTHDRMDWLPAAVDSVLEQTFADFELLVVDDGSTDGTDAYLDALDDPRVRTIRLTHGGNVARARNAGAAAATGRYLAFLDSDDVWLPEKLEVQLAAMADGEAGWSYTRYEHMDPGGRAIAARAGRWRPLSGRIALPLITTEASVWIVTVMVRRDLFDALGGFDERPLIREDHELLVRLAVRSEARVVPQCLARVRDHPGRSTRRLSGARPFIVSARTCEAMLESLDDDVLRRAARRRIAHHLADAGEAYLREGSLRAGAASLLRALRLGAPPGRCASALRRGVGLERARLRRLARPVLGREAPAWRWIRWPRLRHVCFGDPVDCVIHALLASKGRVRFVQVGSNDGVTNDPLWTFRRYGNWSGVLVEPLDHAFRRLSRNYAPWRERFAMERVAVAAETGARRLHHLGGSEDDPPGWDQIASLDPRHVRIHGRPFVAAGVDIAASDVRCVTIHELFREHDIAAPDLLHVDAEGADAAILRQIDFERHPPPVVLYEHLHMEPGERDALRARMRAAGYRTLEIEGDTLAVSGQAMDALPLLGAAWKRVAGGPPGSRSA